MLVLVVQALGCRPADEGEETDEPDFDRWEASAFVDLVTGEPLAGQLVVHIWTGIELDVAFAVPVRSAVDDVEVEITFGAPQEQAYSASSYTVLSDWDEVSGLGLAYAARKISRHNELDLWCVLPRSTVDVTFAFRPVTSGGAGGVAASRTETLELILSDSEYQSVESRCSE